MAFDDDPEVTIQHAFDYLKQRNWPITGQWLVVITNALAHGKVIDTIQLRLVD